MPVRYTLLFSLLLLIFSACQESTSPVPSATTDPLLIDSSAKTVDIPTEDNITLKGTYYPSETITTNAPVIVLVHMLNSNKESWQNFAAAAQKTGYAVLALDLRGHGESEGRNYAYDAMDKDVEAALKWVFARPEIDGNRVGIAGASIGANLALRKAGSHPEIKSVVLLSPGLDYKGITTKDALELYDQRPILLVAAEKDSYAANSSRMLNSQARGQHKLQIYPNADHGTDIFAAQAGLQPMLLSWFSTTLQ